MIFRLKKILRREKKSGRFPEIDPDEIFLDSSNIPKFNTYQMEGRLEKPISKGTIYLAAFFFILVGAIFLGKTWALQIKSGQIYTLKSENNRLRHTDIFSERGVIYDRNGELLAGNVKNPKNPAFLKREYNGKPGLSHIVGFVKYPSKDSAGFYYAKEIAGMDGVERAFNEELAGKNGTKIIETDALNQIQSESVLRPPENGKNLSLSIDIKLQSRLTDDIKGVAERIGFSGGAAAIMDIQTGEILALASFPEYESQAMSDGNDSKKIKSFTENSKRPFLNRAVDGLYTPGSIVKPFIAIGVLNEKVIDPMKTIVSTGSISIPNPYDPSKKSVFTDWKAHGPVDMRKALAVSSNVYFYEVGGGFESQKGLGIEGMEKYMKIFGFGREINDKYLGGEPGVIPNPLWKAENFQGEKWRIGDTYNTAIGQYGFQVTPILAVRAIAAIGNGGRFFEPTVLKMEKGQTAPSVKIEVPQEYFKIVQEGMREGVISGTAKGLNLPQVNIAAKTGTAELGTVKKLVNSWVIGFFPYEKPKIAFAAIMERGPRENTIGALYAMRETIDWMSVYTPEYLR